MDSTIEAWRTPGSIVLISCYELGQQPLGLVQAASSLRQAGYQPLLQDIDVEPLDEDAVARARLVGISVPMHTALKLGVAVARNARRVNPNCHIVFFGLYASLNADYLLETVADHCIGAELEQPLVDLVASLEETGRPPARKMDSTEELALTRRSKQPPASREGLPPLDRYAHLLTYDRTVPVGYVTSTRGCKHSCRHCPLPPVYYGRFYALPVDHVIQDIAQLIDAGARHITFGDADFLNGPGHADSVTSALHAEFPDVTFDITVKIEHLLKQKALVRLLTKRGCLFVVSAIESFSNRTLQALDKGHTRNDALDAIRLCRDIQLTLRPTFVPFTPWDTLEDFRFLLATIEAEGLVDHIDPVQYTIRLLVPPRSLLANSPDMIPYLGELEQPDLTYAWRHPDPRMDELHSWIAATVSEATQDNVDPALTFFRVGARARELHTATGVEVDLGRIARRYAHGRMKPPRLTESWFC